MPSKLTFNMKEWFLESSFPGVRRCKVDAFRIDKELFRGKTKFQDIFIFKSPGFGKVLTLDGIIQLSQSDEFIYHEIIAHVPLMTHPDPTRFLVVGGGDGGVLREASKHPLKELYMVEIDKDVVGIAKKYLPFISNGAFEDKRLRLLFENGKTFMKKYNGYFDVIIVDSTDPVGPGKALFQADFYKDVRDALSPDGVAMFQLGPFLDFDLIIRDIAKRLKNLFPYVNPVRLAMPSYSCGCEYCFLLASKKVNPRTVPLPTLKQRFAKRLGAKASTLKYYTPEIHQASLVMPKIWQV